MADDDLTGRRVRLKLNDFGDREKFRGALFQTGDVGTVMMPSRRHEGAWVVSMHGAATLFFTDELEEVEMICKPCTQAQHDKCAYPVSCPCHHRQIVQKDEPTADPKDC